MVSDSTVAPGQLLQRDDAAGGGEDRTLHHGSSDHDGVSCASGDRQQVSCSAGGISDSLVCDMKHGIEVHHIEV